MVLLGIFPTYTNEISLQPMVSDFICWNQLLYLEIFSGVLAVYPVPLYLQHSMCPSVYNPISSPYPENEGIFAR